MKDALLLLLLTLTGQANPAPPPSALPAAVAAPAQVAPAGAQAVRAPARIVPVETVLGAWLGRWIPDGPASPGPLEVVFSRGLRASTVLGHFTFVDQGVTRTTRRLGRLQDGGLAFDLPGGGAIALRPDGADRLVGEVVEGVDARRGALELTRLRR